MPGPVPQPQADALRHAAPLCAPAVVRRPGRLWQAGEHQVLCGLLLPGLQARAGPALSGASCLFHGLASRPVRPCRTWTGPQPAGSCRQSWTRSRPHAQQAPSAACLPFLWVGACLRQGRSSWGCTACGGDRVQQRSLPGCRVSGGSMAARQRSRPPRLRREFGSKVRMWCTFNEPGVMGFCGWIYGAFPPAKLAAFTEAGHHLYNLFQAHKAVYHAIKALPGALPPGLQPRCPAGQAGVSSHRPHPGERCSILSARAGHACTLNPC